MRKAKLHQISFLVTLWLLCAAFIALYEGSVLALQAPSPRVGYSLARTLSIVSLVTLVAGTAVSTCEVLLLSRLLRRQPYGISLVLKTAFYLCCILFFTSLAVGLVASFDLDRPVHDPEVLTRLAAYLSSGYVVMSIVYWAACVLLGLFILQVSEKFGQGVLLDLLRGKYHRPREEHRIFMFMDLKSSTAYAERLGLIKYSRLIQDCFYDLTDVVVAHRAMIYQYVGDEVILTWNIARGVEHGNCVRVFFAYDEALGRRRAHYEAHYGLVPEFKAGVNAGRVTVAEIGQIKKELAYHGDVLNTASRIQGKCNDFGTRLLMSGELAHLLDGQTDYALEFVGVTALKGKEQPVKLYQAKASAR